MSTHDMGQARRLADRVLFMLHGRVRENAPARTFFTTSGSLEVRAFIRGDIVE